MIGTFTTTCYDSRHDFDEQRPSGVHVSRNHFTSAGVEWMWRMMAGELRDQDGGLTDHLGSARIVVGNGDQEFAVSDTSLAGDQTAQAALDEGYPRITVEPLDGLAIGRITLSAIFGESEAAFDWRERGVMTAQGVLIDRAVGDQGRKVLGAIWGLEATLDLTG